VIVRALANSDAPGDAGGGAGAGPSHRPVLPPPSPADVLSSGGVPTWAAGEPLTPAGTLHPFSFPPPPGYGAERNDGLSPLTPSGWSLAHTSPGPSPLSPAPPTAAPPARPTTPGPTTSHGSEVVVHTRSRSKVAFGRLRTSTKDAHSNEIEGWWEDPDDPVHVLHACGPAIDALWADAQVRARLTEKRLRIEEDSGFYLNDVARVTAVKFFPTDGACAGHMAGRGARGG
jgi:hypothetical protein